MNNVDHVLLCSGKVKNKYSPVSIWNQGRMIQEGLHQPYLEKSEKFHANKQERRKRVFFNQQTKEIKAAIKLALTVPSTKVLIDQKIQF
jgi:hypothetical protein